MTDLQRSLLFVAGISAGLLAGLSGSADPVEMTSRAPGPAAVESAPAAMMEVPATSSTSEAVLSGHSASVAPGAGWSARLADWWQRALSLRPGEAPALFREIDRELGMGGRLIGTFFVVAAGSDPEGALAYYRELKARGVQHSGNTLFRAWALHDAAAAERAALSLPAEDQERFINIIRDITKRAEPPADGLRLPKSPQH